MFTSFHSHLFEFLVLLLLENRAAYVLTVHVMSTRKKCFPSFLIRKSSNFQSFRFSPKSSQVLIVSFKLINMLSNKRSLKCEKKTIHI